MAASPREGRGLTGAATMAFQSRVEGVGTAVSFQHPVRGAYGLFMMGWLWVK